LLKDVPGITWAVQGHSQQQLEPPEIVGDARLMEAMNEGKLGGRLDIHVIDGGMTFADKGERAQLITIIEDQRRQLADIERRAAEDKTDQLRDYYKLRREGIAAAIVRETELARKLPAVVHGSWYENQIIPLDESIPDHPAIKQMVEIYNAENARRAAAGLPVGIEMRDPHAPAPVPASTASPASSRSSSRSSSSSSRGLVIGGSVVAGSAAGGSAASTDSTTVGTSGPTTYAGSVACAGCHEPAWRFFLSTKHARALTALAPAHRDRDPSCIGCHTTGYLLPGGTGNIREATHRLKDVGCESCHGPGLEHLTSADKKRTTRLQVGVLTCLGCHTADRTSGEFDYQRFRRAILGPGHGA
jgi:hypothetical protein